MAEWDGCTTHWFMQQHSLDIVLTINNFSILSPSAVLQTGVFDLCMPHSTKQ